MRVRNVYFTCFTRNDPLLTNAMRFIQWGELETCDYSNDEHYHGYAEFNTQVRLNFALSQLPNTSKVDTSGTWREYTHSLGIRKKQGMHLELMIHTHSSLRSLMDIEPLTYCRFRNGLKDIYSTKLRKYYEKKYVTWIYGGTGKGKTRKAYEDFGYNCWVSSNTLQWFDGYMGQDNVIFDDMRKTSVSFEFLLRLLDGYPMYVPVKGSFTSWDCKRITITSCFSPQQCFNSSKNEDLAQLTRRIDRVIHLD
jgi:hypothetical protein